MFQFLRTFVSHSEGLNPHQKFPVEIGESVRNEDSKEKKKKKSINVENDPLSCVNPACADKLSFFKQAMSIELKKEQNSSHSLSTDKEKSSSSTPEETIVIDCPLDRSELGRSTWNFLHTLAAYYPESPSSEQKQYAVNLFQAIAELYPCNYCASEFQESIARNPPKVESRQDLSIWLCNQHNEVNERLGKPNFPCSLEALDERWRDGKPGCWNYNVKDKLHDDLPK